MGDNEENLAEALITSAKTGITTRSSGLIRRGLNLVCESGHSTRESRITEASIDHIQDVLDTVYQNHFQSLGYKHETPGDKRKLAEATCSEMKNGNLHLLRLTDEQATRYVTTIFPVGQGKMQFVANALRASRGLEHDERVKSVAAGDPDDQCLF